MGSGKDMKIRNGEFWLGNCLELMKNIPDNSVDMILTSPPYDDLRIYGEKHIWNFEIFKIVAKILSQKLKQKGVIIWVVNDQTIKGIETLTSFKQAIYFKENCELNLHDTMIYKKENPPPVGGKKRYYQSFEYMFVFSKDQPKTFNPLMIKRKNKYNDKRTKRIKSFTRNKYGEFTKKEVKLDFNSPVKSKNIFSYIVGGGNSVDYNVKHPAAFPYQLAIDQILSWSNEGDIILDPFAGSGTTAVAAENTNRKWICIEQLEEYYYPAIMRVSAN